MQVNHVKIINLLGISKLEFQAGKFNEFRGPNGSGKTSGMESVKACVKGGHDATILRRGQEKGEAVLELSSGKSLRTRVTQTKTDRAILSDSGRIEGGVTEIKALVDALAVNPVEFITASPDRRADIVLKAMPLRADPARLESITGMKVSENLNVHALDLIERLRKEIYDDRTATNGALKQAEAGKARTIATMPEVEAVDFDENELNAERERLESEREKSKAGLENRLSGIVSKLGDEIQVVRDEIESLKQQIREKENLISQKQLSISDQKRKGAQKISEVCGEFDAKINEVKAKLRSISENRENASRAKIAREQMDQADKEIESLKGTSVRFTSILDQLDEYKLELLNNLPIPGLEVKNGDVHFGGVPFDRVNTAQKVKIAVEIAKIMAESSAKENGSSLPIICVDGMECMDESTYEMFKQEMLQSGCQVFVTRVGGDRFEVQVTNPDESHDPNQESFL